MTFDTLLRVYAVFKDSVLRDDFLWWKSTFFSKAGPLDKAFSAKMSDFRHTTRQPLLNLKTGTSCGFSDWQGLEKWPFLAEKWRYLCIAEKRRFGHLGFLKNRKTQYRRLEHAKMWHSTHCCESTRFLRTPFYAMIFDGENWGFSVKRAPWTTRFWQKGQIFDTKRFNHS